MKILCAISIVVDRLDHVLGNILSVLVWVTALVCATVVVLRYVFHETFAWMQDLYVWTHAIVFLAGIALAMGRDAHVRVDILYSRWTPRRKAVMEIIGILTCILPWMGILVWYAWPVVVTSWQINEGSPQPNGMPAVYLLKSMLLVFTTLVFFQAISLLARSFRVLSGDADAAKRPPFAATPDVIDHA